MKYKILFLLALPCLFISNLAFSQQSDVIFNQLKTKEYMNQIRSSPDGSLKIQTSGIEAQIREFNKFGKITPKSVPIVFHVIRTNSMSDFSIDLIQTQIDALNRDFSTLQIFEDHPNDPDGIYSSRAEIPKIQFCSPSYDEDGIMSIGYTSVNVGHSDSSNANDIKFTKSGGKDAWNTDEYINVWITDLKEDQSGFAQMPGGQEEIDGIVIDYKFFGQFESDDNPFNQGKTLTHLMGNYLGLHSLWSDVECGDDYVDDTPIHNSINFGGPEPGHVSLCEGYTPEMTMNFMDATYDEGKYMFTKGQVKRMHAILSKKGFRSNLNNTEIQCEKSVQTELTDTQEVEENQSPLILIELRPNPAKDYVFIDFKNLTAQDHVLYQVINIKGEIIENGDLQIQSNSPSLETTAWASGIYFLRFTFDSETITKRLIID